jgi:hypothetical protein
MSTKFLRRYCDLTSLIYLLKNRSVTLLDPASWDDGNDSYYMTVYREKKALTSVLALCFTETAEKYHYWKVFANGSSGVSIQFKRASLLRAIRKQRGVTVRRVRYLSLAAMGSENLRTRDLPFSKRIVFKDEHEFRILYESNTKTPKLDIQIPISCIDQVTLSPWMHPDLVACVRGTIRAIEGCRGLHIIRSTLIGNEVWKEFGDAAR